MEVGCLLCARSAGVGVRNGLAAMRCCYGRKDIVVCGDLGFVLILVGYLFSNTKCSLFIK